MGKREQRTRTAARWAASLAAVGAAAVAGHFVRRLLGGDPERPAYPAPRAGYRAEFAGPDGTVPAYWQQPTGHDALDRRLPGSFESSRRR